MEPEENPRLHSPLRPGAGSGDASSPPGIETGAFSGAASPEEWENFVQKVFSELEKRFQLAEEDKQALRAQLMGRSNHDFSEWIPSSWTPFTELKKELDDISKWMDGYEESQDWREHKDKKGRPPPLFPHRASVLVALGVLAAGGKPSFQPARSDLEKLLNQTKTWFVVGCETCPSFWQGLNMDVDFDARPSWRAGHMKPIRRRTLRYMTAEQGSGHRTTVLQANKMTWPLRGAVYTSAHLQIKAPAETKGQTVAASGSDHKRTVSQRHQTEGSETDVDRPPAKKSVKQTDIPKTVSDKAPPGQALPEGARVRTLRPRRVCNPFLKDDDDEDLVEDGAHGGKGQGKNNTGGDKDQAEDDPEAARFVAIKQERDAMSLTSLPSRQPGDKVVIDLTSDAVAAQPQEEQPAAQAQEGVDAGDRGKTATTSLLSIIAHEVATTHSGKPLGHGFFKDFPWPPKNAACSLPKNNTSNEDEEAAAEPSSESTHTAQVLGDKDGIFARYEPCGSGYDLLLSEEIVTKQQLNKALRTQQQQIIEELDRMRQQHQAHSVQNPTLDQSRSLPESHKLEILALVKQEVGKVLEDGDGQAVKKQASVNLGDQVDSIVDRAMSKFRVGMSTLTAQVNTLEGQMSTMERDGELDMQALKDQLALESGLGEAIDWETAEQEAALGELFTVGLDVKVIRWSPGLWKSNSESQAAESGRGVIAKVNEAVAKMEARAWNMQRKYMHWLACRHEVDWMVFVLLILDWNLEVGVGTWEQDVPGVELGRRVYVEAVMGTYDEPTKLRLKSMLRITLE